MIVHLKVADPPTVSPVIVDVGEAGVVIVAAPAVTVHKPVPVAGVLPASVAVVTLHRFWSAPAAEVVGGEATLMITSSVEAAHAPLLIVHLSVALAPTVKPVKPLVAEAGVVIVAAPAVTVHKPVPVTGTLPANVAVVTLHKF